MKTSNLERKEEKVWRWKESPDIQYNFWKGFQEQDQKAVGPGKEIKVFGRDLVNFMLLVVLNFDVAWNWSSAKCGGHQEDGTFQKSWNSCGGKGKKQWDVAFGGNDCWGDIRV